MFGQITVSSNNVYEIILDDSNLGVKLVVNNLDYIASIAFVGPNDILVLEKNTC
ncbi:MAG: hypothetical protein ACPKQO_10180 [Nitrososphaeraceae archaeon]